MVRQKTLPNGLTLYKNRGANASYLSASHNAKIEDMFLEIIHLAKQIDATLLVSLFPSKESVYKSDYARLFQAEYLRNEEEGYARLCKIAAENGSECLNLTSVFRSWAGTGKKAYFDKDPHWNNLGHSIAADALWPLITASLAR